VVEITSSSEDRFSPEPVVEAPEPEPVVEEVKRDPELKLV
jgi:hypothetical protein